MAYIIVHRRDFRQPEPAWVDMRIFRNLKDAQWMRLVSGDIVIDSKTGNIVTDPDWLWDWEKKSPNCYSQQAIRWQAAKNWNHAPHLQ